jgi:hypothetical protein
MGTQSNYFSVTAVIALCCACATSTANSKAEDPETAHAPKADKAASDSTDPPKADTATQDDVEQKTADAPKADSASQDDEGTESAKSDTSHPAAEQPHFTEGMSVNEAIKAVPTGTEYLSLDGDTLGKPLADLELYKPCKLNPSQHFKLRVAVWEGKAVGIDVSSANKKLAECVRQQVSQVQWHDKVKSINTVDYSY